MTHEVLIAEQHFYRSVVRQRYFLYQNADVGGFHLRQYKPRTIRDFRKRESSLWVALSGPDHVLQTRLGCFWRVRFASSDEVVDHFSKVRSSWQQQDPVPCARDGTDDFLVENSLSSYAIFALMRIGFMFSVVELRLHLYKPWRRPSRRLPRRLLSRASRVCERQAEYYCKRSNCCPESYHFIPVAIARPASRQRAQKAAN